MREGLSYGCGDAVIGVNPATDTPESTAEILTAIDEVLKRNGDPDAALRALARDRADEGARALGCPMDLMFQSLAGTEAGNGRSASASSCSTKRGR